MPRLWWVIEELVPDGLWERVAPLLPPPKLRRHRYPGRRPSEDRAALPGIVVVLTTGITWNQLPTALVGCSGVSCAPPASWTWTGARSTARTSAPPRGGPCRPVPGRPRPARLQAPPDLRRRRHPAGGHPHRRPPPRRHPADPAARRRAADPRPAGPAPPPTAGAVRRPWRRPRLLPPPAPQPWHHPADHPPRGSPRLRAGPPALGGRAWLRLAARLQAAPHPLRTPRRPPPRAAPAGLHPDLLPPARRRSEMSSYKES